MDMDTDQAREEWEGIITTITGITTITHPIITSTGGVPDVGA